VLTQPAADLPATDELDPADLPAVNFKLRPAPHCHQCLDGLAGLKLAEDSRGTSRRPLRSIGIGMKSCLIVGVTSPLRVDRYDMT
jgi:hypothetical protein